MPRPSLLRIRMRQVAQAKKKSVTLDWNRICTDVDILNENEENNRDTTFSSNVACESDVNGNSRQSSEIRLDQWSPLLSMHQPDCDHLELEAEHFLTAPSDPQRMPLLSPVFSTATTFKRCKPPVLHSLDAFSGSTPIYHHDINVCEFDKKRLRNENYLLKTKNVRLFNKSLIWKRNVATLRDDYRKLEKIYEYQKNRLRFLEEDYKKYREINEKEHLSNIKRIEVLENELSKLRNRESEVKLISNNQHVVLVRPYGGAGKYKPYFYVPRATVDSSSASLSSLQKRSIILHDCLRQLSGCEAPEQARQIVAFLESRAAVSDLVKEHLINSVLISKIQLTPLETLNFMSTINLTIYQVKMMKRFFINSKNIKLFCSDSQLREAANLSRPLVDFAVEKITLQEEKQSVQRSCVKATSFKTFLEESWKKTCKTQKLIEHDGFGKFVWVAIGGDKGGSSTKLVIAFLNVENQHSVRNIHVVGCFIGHDSALNIRKAFSSYSEEFVQLREMKLPFPVDSGHEMRSVKFFLFGDCNFISHFMGHQGASSSKPCLFCHIRLCDLRKPTIETIISAKIASRSLPEIIHNANSYNRAPISKDSAQMFNNITAVPLLRIEIGNIAVPVMHIQLGIAANLWSMMYDQCLNHDLHQMGVEEKTTKRSAVKLMKDKAEDCKRKKEELESLKSSLKTVKRALRTATTVAKSAVDQDSDGDDKCSAELCFAEETHNGDALFWLQCDSCHKWYHAECMLVFNEEELHIECDRLEWVCLRCRGEVPITAAAVLSKLEEKIAVLQLAIGSQQDQYDRTRLQFQEQENLLKFGQGQAIFALESSLDDLNIDRLAYHSGTFVGNHVHKMLCGSGPKKLTEALLLVDKHRQRAFEDLYTLLGKIHIVITAPRFLTSAEIGQLDIDCRTFGAMILENFPTESIIPKIHLLVKHVPEFAMRHGTVGLFSEQGLEALHAKMNSFSRIFAGVRCPLNRLQMVMKRGAIASSVPAAERKKFYPMSGK